MSSSIQTNSPIIRRHGANLPHWTAQGATYFVTFRLHDSLPAQKVLAWKQERDRLLEAIQSTPKSPHASPFTITARDIQRLHQLFAGRIEHYLDAGAGACWMKRPNVAAIVQSALFHFYGDRYDLHAWCLMPNHVHAVLHPLGVSTLPEILHSWKSFTAKQANRILGRSGPFWQAESYDHLVRDKSDWRHCIDYTLCNPAKAGLPDWPWAGLSPTIEHRRDADATENS